MSVFLLAQSFLLIGFCLGWILSTKKFQQSHAENKDFFSRKEPEIHSMKKSAVKIDDAKFVTDISTSELKQNNIEIGKQTSVDDDISSSVNRLAHLKKLK